MTTAVFGYGPLDAWLHDDSISEILVNRGADVWVERRRRPGPELVGQLDPGVAEAIVERMLAPIGRRLDRSSPMVDARLPDGSRLCAVMPPVSVDGLTIAVRRFAVEQIPLEQWATEGVAELLHDVIEQHCNVLVSGATSSGKTTLLNSLTSLIDRRERVITLEDTAELCLGTPHVVRLETRSRSPEGVAAVELDDLLRTALRLRPDRLVIGEIRGAEAADLVQALNTGHDGSLATIHANSPTDALARLESLVVRHHPAWPFTAVRDQVRRSIDVVVHLARGADGARRVREIVEVRDSDGPDGVRRLTLDDVVVAHLQRGRPAP